MFDIDHILECDMQEEDELEVILDDEGTLIDLVADGNAESMTESSMDIFNDPIKEKGKEIFI